MLKLIRLIFFVCILVLAIIPMGWSATYDSFSPIEYRPELDVIKETPKVKEVNASHILVKTEAEALEIRNKIIKGASFEEMAKKYSLCPSNSNGGNLGFFGKGVMDENFEKVAFSLPVGEISQPVATQFGYHLIKVIAQR